MRLTLLILCLVLAGCGDAIPTQPPRTVQIVLVAKTTTPEAKLRTHRSPYTVVEDVRTGERWYVPGVIGAPGDEFTWNNKLTRYSVGAP